MYMWSYYMYIAIHIWQTSLSICVHVCIHGTMLCWHILCNTVSGGRGTQCCCNEHCVKKTSCQERVSQQTLLLQLQVILMQRQNWSVYLQVMWTACARWQPEKHISLSQCMMYIYCSSPGKIPNADSCHKLIYNMYKCTLHAWSMCA